MLNNLNTLVRRIIKGIISSECLYYCIFTMCVKRSCLPLIVANVLKLVRVMVAAGACPRAVIRPKGGVGPSRGHKYAHNVGHSLLLLPLP